MMCDLSLKSALMKIKADLIFAKIRLEKLVVIIRLI